MKWVVIALIVIAVVVVVRQMRAAQAGGGARGGGVDEVQLSAVTRAADEDVTVFGEELQRLDDQLGGHDLDEGMRADYQRALDAYEASKESLAAVRRPDDVRHVPRYSRTAGMPWLACARGSRASRCPRRAAVLLQPAAWPIGARRAVDARGGAPGRSRRARSTRSGSRRAPSRTLARCWSGPGGCRTGTRGLAILALGSGLLRRLRADGRPLRGDDADGCRGGGLDGDGGDDDRLGGEGWWLRRRRSRSGRLRRWRRSRRLRLRRMGRRGMGQRRMGWFRRGGGFDGEAVSDTRAAVVSRCQCWTQSDHRRARAQSPSEPSRLHCTLARSRTDPGFPTHRRGTVRTAQSSRSERLIRNLGQSR